MTMVLLLAGNIWSGSKQGLLLQESFEGDTFPPAGWSKLTELGGTGWAQAAVDSSLAGLIGLGTVDTPAGGGNAVAYASWVTGDADQNANTTQATEQWLITPQIAGVQAGDSLRFSMKFFSQFFDNLDIVVSTTNADSIASFDTTLLRIVFDPANPLNDWQRFSVDLSSFAGQAIFIGFREHVPSTVNSGDAVLIDLVEVGSLVTSVDDQTSQPTQFSLNQNFPNPFNPSTNISFTLSQRAEVSLKVYNVIGQSVAVLIERQILEAGARTIQFNATALPTGVYYYKLEAGNAVAVKRMTLVR